MGQGYTVAVEFVPKSFRDDTKVVMFNPHHFGQGYKLMEFAYLGNPFTTRIRQRLFRSGVGTEVRIGVVGDYATVPSYEGDDAVSEDDRKAENCRWRLTTLCNRLGYNVGQMFDREHPGLGIDFVNADRYLVCDEAGEYISLDPSEDKVRDVSNIDPLMLLCADGNGHGGGDYMGDGMEHVGKWAYRSLRVCDKDGVPKDYERIVPTMFREKW